MLRMPATTSSPCALTRKSPYGLLSPVAALRVKPTPVPELSSRFPKTIAWIFTAVPSSWFIFSRTRYAIARAPFHERNTASTAPRSCFIGSCGNSLPVDCLTTVLYVSHKSRRADAGSSASDDTPAFDLAITNGCSNLSPSIPSTIRPYIEMKRR